MLLIMSRRVLPTNGSPGVVVFASLFHTFLKNKTMKSNNNILFLAIALASSTAALAQNPIIQTQLTTDPAPLVCGDRIDVYTGHDEDHADFFWMNEWRVYSSTDMGNWTDDGSPLNQSSFAWADDRAWAAQAIERNGKY